MRCAIVSLILLLTACRPKVPLTPEPMRNVFVLLPEPDGKVGAIQVTNAAGSVDLTDGYQAVQIERRDTAPQPFSMPKQEVDRVFAATIASLPPPERVFLIHFDQGNEGLRAGADQYLNDAVASISAQHSVDVSIVGHADATGDHAANFQLGLRRAQTVKESLLALGVDGQILSVESHGDLDLAVQTSKGEIRNRRVEIIVR